MELLLFVLFMLFSGFSALMGRRKRRKELEEAQKQQEARQQSQAEKSNEVEVPAARPAPPVVVVEEEKEEDPSFAWPFEGDPFEEFRPAAVDPASLVPQALEAEREALEAERRALAVEKRALAMERMSLDTGSGSAFEPLERGAGQSRRRSRGKGKVGRWLFDAQKARDAIIYSEIIGKPVGERED